MANEKLVLWFVCALLCTLSGASLCAASFDRYQIIVDRKPFGDPPPPPKRAEREPLRQQDSFAKTLRMSTMIELDDGLVKIGLVDLKTKESFFLKEGGEAERDISLVQANYEEEEVVLRKGEEMAILKLADDAFETIAATDKRLQTREERKRRRSSRRARRAAAAEQVKAEAKVAAQPLKGDAWDHLQDYAEEVIRQGLPPLPIPLTVEQDDRLVEEGFLPPLEELPDE